MVCSCFRTCNFRERESQLQIASCGSEHIVIIWSLGGESAAPVSKAVASAMRTMISDDHPGNGSGSGCGSGSIACIRTQARVNVLQTLTNQSSVLYAININLSARLAPSWRSRWRRSEWPSDFVLVRSRQLMPVGATRPCSRVVSHHCRVSDRS